MCTEYNLQPCPKCGEKHDLHIVASTSWTAYFVMCWNCDYESSSFSRKDAAVRHWNSLKREEVSDAN